MAKQEPKIELVYVGLHPGEEEMTLEEVENEEQENQLDMAREAIRRASGPSAFKERIRVFRTEEEKSADGSGIGAIDLNANNDEQRNVPVSSLFQTWRQKMNALPRIEVPRSLTAKQFLEIQAMGAESRTEERKARRRKTDWRRRRQMWEKLPDTRRSIKHKAVILSEKDGKLDRVKFYFTIGFYPDGRPGELFMHMDEAGSTLDGTADSFGITVSFSLQNGVTWEKLAEKLAYQQFNPQGMTENPELRFVKSYVDYVMRWGVLQFCGNAECRMQNAEKNGAEKI